MRTCQNSLTATMLPERNIPGLSCVTGMDLTASGLFFAHFTDGRRLIDRPPPSFRLQVARAGSPSLPGRSTTVAIGVRKGAEDGDPRRRVGRIGTGSRPRRSGRWG